MRQEINCCSKHAPALCIFCIVHCGGAFTDTILKLRSTDEILKSVLISATQLYQQNELKYLNDDNNCPALVFEPIKRNNTEKQESTKGVSYQHVVSKSAHNSSQLSSYVPAIH